MNELMSFANGDLDYIAKHNANYNAIKQAVDALEALMSAQVSSGMNPGAAYTVLFGTTAAVIGENSYKCTGSGTNLTVQSGFFWKPSIQSVTRLVSNATISFSGQAAATYYIQIDASGSPNRSTDITEAAYSVVWTGSAFGTITRLANVVWGAADQILTQSNAALGTSYTSLDALLEAIATKAVAGDLAQTWKKGKLSKSVAGGANVALTATEANNFHLVFTGTLTADIEVSVPLSGGPRGWVVENATSGAYSLTLKGSSGAGIKLAQGSRLWAMHDGSAIIAVGTAPYQPAVVAVPFSASPSVDFSYADTATLTVTGACAITLTGAKNKQKCVLEITQGGAGGFTPTFGSEVRLGSDLTVVTFSSDPGKTDKLGFIYDAASGKYDLVAIMRGF